MVAEHMAGEQPVELSGEEQTLQSAARQNAAGESIVQPGASPPAWSTSQRPRCK